jgi:hypothetical protein
MTFHSDRFSTSPMIKPMAIGSVCRYSRRPPYLSTRDLASHAIRKEKVRGYCRRLNPIMKPTVFDADGGSILDAD